MEGWVGVSVNIKKLKCHSFQTHIEAGSSAVFIRGKNAGRSAVCNLEIMTITNDKHMPSIYMMKL